MTISYGRVTFQENRWLLSDVPPHVAIRLKSMFPRIPKHQTVVFDLPNTTSMCADILWFLQRYDMEISEVDRALLLNGGEQFEKDRLATEQILMPDWVPPEKHGFRPGKDAYLMQKQAAELWIKKKGLLIGDPTGLGKTISALYGLAGSPYLPAAVVVQSHLPTQWVNEYIKPFTYMSSHIINGTKPYSLPPANLYIFRYSNISGWSDIAGTGLFKSVIYDEIQELRSGTETRKGAAAMVFSDNAELRLGLSATPIFNYGSEIFSIMRFLDAEVLGEWPDFLREWCRMGPGQKWIVKDPDALGSYLREAQVFIRRDKQGRKINRIPIEVAFDQKVADDAAELAKALAQKVIGGSFVEAGLAARELDAFARLQTGLAKAKSVAMLAKMHLSKGIPIILAGWHRAVYDCWMEELKEFKPVLYTGSETGRQKDRAKDDFIAGKTDLMIISLRSGAGVDGLQKRCSTVIIGELDWAPAVIEQLLGRVDRPGQPAEEITAIFPYVEYGSDPTIIRVNAIKSDQARGINNPGLAPLPVYTDESRIRMLAKSFLGDEE